MTNSRRRLSTPMKMVEFRGGRGHSRDAAAMGVFCLYIRVKLKREMIPEFKERWGVLAKHVRENEPETLSYELCASDQNDDEFMIVEVCPSRTPPNLPSSPSPSPLPIRPLRAEIPLPRPAGGPAPDQRAIQGVQGVVDQLRRGFGKVGHELRGDGHRIRRKVTSRATPFATRRLEFSFSFLRVSLAILSRCLETSAAATDGAAGPPPCSRTRLIRRAARALRRLL